MMSPIALTLAALLVTPLLLPPQETEEVEVEPEVQLEFLADVDGVTPGQEFLLAALLDMPEHFHVYWENAGDSGLPTRIAVSGPDGFEIGAPRFPGPERFELPGGFVNYGYEERAVIFVPVKSPEVIERGASFEFTLEAEWLVCKTACYLQEGKASLRLAATPIGEQPKRANAGRLEPWKERLPRPFEKLEGATEVWSAEGEELRLDLTVGPATGLEFFPAAGGPLELRERTIFPLGGPKCSIALEFARAYGREEETPIARGVLRVTREARDRYYRVQFTPSARPPGGEAGGGLSFSRSGGSQPILNQTEASR